MNENSDVVLKKVLRNVESTSLDVNNLIAYGIDNALVHYGNILLYLYLQPLGLVTV
jgi:hypothetical protein